MDLYYKITKERDIEEVNKLKSEGWEVITTETVKDIDQSETIYYHLGLSYERYAKELLKIIREYETHGLKEKLFENIAVKNGEDYSEIEEDKNSFWIGVNQNTTTKFMTKYDKLVNDKNQSTL